MRLTRWRSAVFPLVAGYIVLVERKVMADMQVRLGPMRAELPADRQQVKTRLGYVPDRPTVYAWMRVHEAMEFCRSLYGAQWNQERCDELVRTLRLDPERRVKHLSKGAAAKLSLLLAIGHDPQVLILDEPTSGFDPLARDEFLEGILSVNTSPGEETRLRKQRLG